MESCVSSAELQSASTTRITRKPQSTDVYSPAGALIESASFYQPGMTAGIGAEWMFTPNWSVFAEYNYMWFHDDNAQQFTLAGGAPGEVISSSQRVQTVLISVNYKLHWDGPVVAKY